MRRAAEPGAGTAERAKLPSGAPGGEPVLAVEDLTVVVGGAEGPRPVVSGLSFALGRGETLCIAGESGSGKSMTALAIMGLLPRPAARLAGGAIRLGGRDLTKLGEGAMRRIRGDRIAMIFQEPMTSLNPVLTIGRQLVEAIETHTGVGRGEARMGAVEALRAVRIPEAESRMGHYPHELSGGMRQRVMIAMALALRPDVLIADEPTTALDVTVQGEVLELLRDLQRAFGTSIILITHDMGVVAEMADRVIVMREARMVEEGPAGELFARPKAPYTKALLAAVPRIGTGAARPHPRPAGERKPAPVALVKDLTVRFDLRGGFLNRVNRRVHAVEGISFEIAPNETLSLVGESGCGKSTTAKAIAGLVPYAGDVVIAGRNLAGLDRRQAKAVRRDVQMIFQDPFASLDPRMRVGDLVAEPMAIHGVAARAERRDRVAALFGRVGLSPDQMERYPHEFSGGQRQRICIARALALRPKLIVADESVSALDVSVQARVLALLRELQAEFGIAYLFISHDMAVVENISDRVAVMYLGQIVETGTRDQIFSNPQHPYTRRLIEAVPVPDPARRRRAFPRMDRDMPSPVRPLGDEPARLALRDIGDAHLVAA
ncbi:ABC transporter ATP-binding protein [Propylenella binzhouense]|uniref:ABC transporter ATP-binding protein n=1 Tax=Propylenella binzhouense TaxID=2555902 RepID=A0A964T6L2_9HYPH|nr:ABC transporter ATP-binding protein [Propylenella binzhouense]MYZ48779.1 ABC transporter ATP-binding protein [Propylenella binzhouense]